ncbi:hypothetical protein B0H17DRAFT_399071 [Mycena rosella]|uniref:Uncharacterized protein n=1 Tax=Mycena rosella TaxID=1033263 RepID=A0AAD7GNR8_MYCRO|nr:hypothetical protein B0H17DRAFT_399071 [Mycena rosella]
MFRVLDLISERGSSGLVNKILISQDSLKAFINELSPGAYSSLTKVDFKTLDQLLIKPAGLYGSKSEIVAFLSAQGAIDELTARALCLSRDQSSGPCLRSGLYLLRNFGLEPNKEQIFVIYWPEDTTWDDNAMPSIARNRETFMRYLTKICDQVTCMISEEHAQSIVWIDDSEDAATNMENNKPSRLYKFKVAKTNEQEEMVTTRPGFTINAPIFTASSDALPDAINPADLKPKLVGGETTQALLITDYVPAGLREVPFQATYNQTRIRDLLNGTIEFSLELPVDAIETLISASSGFESRYRNALESWKSRNARTNHMLDNQFKKQEAEMLSRVSKETEEMAEIYRQALIDRLWDRFPFIPSDSLSSVSDEERSRFRNQFSARIELYPSINAELEHILANHKIDVVASEKFKNFKEILIHIEVVLRHDPRREETVIELLKARGFSTPTKSDGRKVFTVMKSYASAAAASLASAASTAVASMSRNVQQNQDDLIANKTRRLIATTSDAQFLTGLDDLLVMEPALSDIISQTIAVATGHLNGLINKLSKTIVGRATQIQQDTLKLQLKRNMNKELLQSSQESLRILRADMETQTPSADVRITSCATEKPHRGHAAYNVQGFKRSRNLASLDCRLYLLSLTTDERQMLQMDPAFIPSPRITHNSSFLLEPGRRISCSTHREWRPSSGARGSYQYFSLLGKTL